MRVALLKINTQPWTGLWSNLAGCPECLLPLTVHLNLAVSPASRLCWDLFVVAQWFMISFRLLANCLTKLTFFEVTLHSIQTFKSCLNGFLNA